MSEEARARLRREAQLLAGVRSPHVACCLGVDRGAREFTGAMRLGHGRV